MSVKRSRRRRAIKRSGLPGLATITALRQTGTVVNNVNFGIELHLEVQLADGRPAYQAKVMEYVPAYLLGRLTQGVALPVRADPKDPMSVVVVWDESPDGVQTAVPDLTDPREAAAQVAMEELRRQGVRIAQLSSVQFEAALEADRATLRSIGIGGTAVVKKAKDMGTTLGEMRAFRLDLEITADDGRPPYLSAGPTAIPVAIVPRLRAGLRVRVKIHPQDPDAMVFEWNERVPA